jgi:hypothetical protein
VTRRALAALAASLFLAACAKEEPAAPPPPKAEVQHAAVSDGPERNDLAALTNGGVVIDRSGETTLELGAVGLIDGDPESFWMGIPHYVPQSATIALSARSRVESIGIRTTRRADVAVKDFRVEASNDGRTFSPLLTASLKPIQDPQFFNVPATEASFLRLTLLSSSGKNNDMYAASFIVRGKEVEPIAAPQLAGAWSINGREASFDQRGNHVVGQLALGKQTMIIDGGADANRMVRLNWIRGNDYGMTALSVSRDGRHLSGLMWHEEAIPLFFSEQWFGEKKASANATAAFNRDGFAIAYLQRTGRWPLFGLHFNADGTLDEHDSDDELAVLVRVIAGAPLPLRLVSHELREATPAANRARATRALTSLTEVLKKRGVNLSKIELVAAGSENTRQTPFTNATRALYSSVDLEIRR